MKVKVWGARGSVPAPGPHMNRYGGNTSCVQVTLDGGEELILDAGTGIRNLGLNLLNGPKVNLLLTHLHLDHIQGLMFFPPCFQEDSSITIWGPASPEASLEDRIARYISAPLSPVEIRELPCDVAFRDTPATEWTIGTATVRAEAVTHRGPTLGYRITEGDVSVCYIPDHEPALGASLEDLDPEWISGFGLACEADLLIHDCQYADDEYPDHIGWGHSALGDTLTFARRVEARSLLLFHHDPLHNDEYLDGLGAEAAKRFAEGGGSADAISMAREGAEHQIDASPGTGPTAGTTAVPEVSTRG